jgi:uncharacterized membrane protein YciS (DUF1049 family)
MFPEFPQALWLQVLVAVLATWRVSLLLVKDEGPFSVFETLRYITRENQIGALLSCVRCTSFWVAWVILGLVYLGAWWLLAGLALSGAAWMLQKGLGDV